MKYIEVRDPKTGEVVASWDYDCDSFCGGFRTGEMGAYCGGCGGCMQMQAEYAGLDVVELEDDPPPFTEKELANI